MWVPGMRQPTVQSTAGAVRVCNEKGEISMEKVKVKRYVSGRRPDYAPMEASDEEDKDFQLIKKAKEQDAEPEKRKEDSSRDPRLRSLQHLIREAAEERMAQHRKMAALDMVGQGDSEVQGDSCQMEQEDGREGEEEEIDDEEIERRRGLLCQRAKERKHEEMEVMEAGEDRHSGQESESECDYEEYIDSEDEMEPHWKPLFIQRKDRVTVQTWKVQALKLKELEQEAKRSAEERRRYTLQIVEEEAKRELGKNRGSLAALDALHTEEENEEEYEAWKVRELKRIKRDREGREALAKEKAETERLGNLTEERRRAELRAKAQGLSNKAVQGRYKFLQKYYHRGAFFMHEDEEVYKRDFSAPTLEDHFNKTLLPKVLQVKNFGCSGRTKYTHLLDQDTTCFESGWAQQTAQNTKFFQQKAAGVGDAFERPSAKKWKTS
ncbi:microfibrillar-associated protein 1-like [Dipodomys spectabilis]|uniref:microfibrillar-associated protein 1-like n=1 Tax=Dipodomys spectabilis TaxID=105255 RepID=UPI001C534A19|nr:microfibrillar-associated protein 1-like [Dipodomys spectabilis]